MRKCVSERVCIIVTSIKEATCVAHSLGCKTAGWQDDGLLLGIVRIVRIVHVAPQNGNRRRPQIVIDKNGNRRKASVFLGC